MLGIAQLGVAAKLNSEVVSYAMGYSVESQVVKYRSVAWFGESEMQRPLLELLYVKKHYDTGF